MLGYNVTLRELDLASNFLRDQEALILAFALKTNTALTNLNLAHNEFRDMPAQEVRHGPSQVLLLLSLSSSSSSSSSSSLSSLSPVSTITKGQYRPQGAGHLF